MAYLPVRLRGIPRIINRQLCKREYDYNNKYKTCDDDSKTGANGNNELQMVQRRQNAVIMAQYSV